MHMFIITTLDVTNFDTNVTILVCCSSLSDYAQIGSFNIEALTNID